MIHNHSSSSTCWYPDLLFVLNSQKNKKLGMIALEWSRIRSFTFSARYDRTALEAEAYAAHISGLHLLEYTDRKLKALAKLQRAR